MEEPDVRPPAPHGASPDGPVGGATGAFEFLPKGFDWKASARATVQRYPMSCLVGATVIGFWLGRNRGRALAAATAGLLANVALKQVARSIDSRDF